MVNTLTTSSALAENLVNGWVVYAASREGVCFGSPYPLTHPIAHAHETGRDYRMEF